MWTRQTSKLAGSWSLTGLRAEVRWPAEDQTLLLRFLHRMGGRARGSPRWLPALGLQFVLWGKPPLLTPKGCLTLIMEAPVTLSTPQLCNSIGEGEKGEINSFGENWGCQKVRFVPGSRLWALQRAAAPPDSPDARGDSCTSDEKESGHFFEVHVSKL